jgi:hypothetical protein
MGNPRNGVTPLEFFLWRRGDKASPQLSSEKTVKGPNGEDNLIGDALRVFNSRTRTVRRSSGGLSVAEPYQIVFFDPTQPNTYKTEPTTTQGRKPEVRIKVRFKDFKVSRNGEVSTGELITHTKVVLPSELGEAFSYDLKKPEAQSFVADFGQGIVPVHVVDFRAEGTGQTMAYFIETGDLAQLLGRESSGAVPVQLYRVDQDVIRHAEMKRAQGGKSEWDLARENYAHLKRRGATVVPPALACGKPVPLASGKSPQEVRQLLEKVIRVTEDPDAALTARKVDTGEMVPFGVFEQ